MPFDKLKYPEELFNERQNAIQHSLQSISVEELKKVANEHQDEFVDDPWRDEFLRLITVQPHANFYRAVPEEGIIVFYCYEADFGIWVLIGSGMGPLDATGKRVMKEAVESARPGGKTGGTRQGN